MERPNSMRILVTGFIILSFFLLQACKKGDSGITPPAEKDVYLAGYIQDANGKNSAAFWKNNKINILDNSTGDSKANGIFISGNDVYTVGSVADANYTRELAVYWKNNTAFPSCKESIKSDGEEYIPMPDIPNMSIALGHDKKNIVQPGIAPFTKTSNGGLLPEYGGDLLKEYSSPEAIIDDREQPANPCTQQQYPGASHVYTAKKFISIS